jgi:hypothetical protein
MLSSAFLLFFFSEDKKSNQNTHVKGKKQHSENVFSMDFIFQTLQIH